MCPTPGNIWCDPDCANPLLDWRYCGDCDTQCVGGQVCADGVCGCEGDLTICPEGCIDTTIDFANCGGCGVSCQPSQSCVGGACRCTNTALTLCGAACVDILTDEAHCGACDVVCGAGETCEAGSCECPGGMTWCDPACVDTDIDGANCGDCGITCDTGRTCIAGLCTQGTGGPCDGICDDPTVQSTQQYVSGDIGVGELCREFAGAIQGGGCFNMANRVFSVNGTVVSASAAGDCGSGFPLSPRNGGFCFHATAGGVSYAAYDTW